VIGKEAPAGVPLSFKHANFSTYSPGL